MANSPERNGRIGEIFLFGGVGEQKRRKQRQRRHLRLIRRLRRGLMTMSAEWGLTESGMMEDARKLMLWKCGHGVIV